MALEALSIESLIPRLRLPLQVALAPAGDRIAYTEARRELDDEGYLTRVLVLERAGDGDWTPLADFDGHGPCWASDGTLAFVATTTEGTGIYLWRAETGAPALLTAADGARELAWHPDAQRLAYTALGVPERAPDDPVVLRDISYRVDGRPLPARCYELRVVERASGASRVLGTGPYDFCAPVWHPTGETLAFGRGSVGDERPDGYVLDLRDGTTMRVTPCGVRCDTLLWSRDGTQLVFAGRLDRRRCGLMRLYALDLASREVWLLAPELEREVATTAGFLPGCDPLLAPDGDSVLFMANDDFDVALYRAPLDGGPARRVLGERFEAVLDADTAAGEVVAIVADPRSPGELVRWDPADDSRETLTALAGDVLAGLVAPEVREFATPDGSTVRGLLLRPPDATGPTPLLLNVHGGPHAAFLGAACDFELCNWEFVARGWSVLLLNPRGSTGRDDAHYRGVVGAWGEPEIEDFLAPIDALIAEGLVDGERVGVTGYSYGGFMTNVLVTRTDRFKAGVAGSSLSNLVSHYGTASRGRYIGEELGGPPPQHWEQRDRLSPIRHVEHVTAPLLLLHGEQDQNVPLSQAEELFALLRSLGKTAELVVYPGCAHSWPDWPLRLRTDTDRRAVEWMTRHVLGLAADGA